MKKRHLFIIIPLLLIVLALIFIFIRLQIWNMRIHSDYSSVFENEKYSEPLYIDGVDPIIQEVSCGYACIEMFSAWNGNDITEKKLFETYGKVITSTGNKYCAEMNKQFPEYRTTMHKYLRNEDLIDLIYDVLSRGIPVPFEWAAKYGEDWTLHYSLIMGMDIPQNVITIANPYGYTEKITVEELLNRTSFTAYENMPLYLKLAFAIGIFEKNTVFEIERISE